MEGETETYRDKLEKVVNFDRSGSLMMEDKVYRIVSVDDSVIVAVNGKDIDVWYCEEHDITSYDQTQLLKHLIDNHGEVILEIQKTGDLK